MKAKHGRPKRSSIDIRASILQFLNSGDEAALSSIVVYVNLNRARTKIYLEVLLSKGLVRTKQYRFLKYSITEDGVKWLKHYRIVVSADDEKADNMTPDFQNALRPLQH